MSREQDAADAVGKQVYNIKNNSKIYMVEKSNKEEVYLRAVSKGCRSTWKWIAHLWLDYRAVD